MASDCGSRRQCELLRDPAKIHFRSCTSILAIAQLVLSGHGDADIGRPTQPGAHGAKTCGVDGQRCTRHRRPHHAGVDVKPAFSIAVCDGPAEHLCRPRHRPHNRWPLRCDDVLRRAAHARDRHSHGAGCATQPVAENDFARSRGAAWNRHLHRIGWGTSLGFCVEKHVVRHRIAQSSGIDSGLHRGGDCRSGCSLHTRSPRGVNRSNGGPPRGVKSV